MLLRCCLAVALMTAAAACSSHSRGAVPAGTTDPDKFLFDKGTEALNDKKWLNAREFFKQVTETYTASPFRPDAKLGIGVCAAEDRQYDARAIPGVAALIKTHPHGRRGRSGSSRSTSTASS